MLKNFNKLIFESLIDTKSYKFSNDQNGNIFCTFSMQNNQYIVNVVQFNKNLTFSIIDKDGQSQNLTQKQFSFKYNEQYQIFKRQLLKYKNGQILSDQSNDDTNKSMIKNFNDQIEDSENDDPNVKLSKDIQIGEIIFNFKILNDLMVENYCQCIFEFFDQKQNKKIGIKSLLFIKAANSMIIKLIVQDQKGQNLMTMTMADFKAKYSEMYLKLKKAIKKFEQFFNQNK